MPSASAQIINGHFSSNLNNWTWNEVGTFDRSSIGNCPGDICPLEQDWYARIQYNNNTNGGFYVTMLQDVDVTNYSSIEFGAKAGAYPSENTGGTVKAYMGSNEVDLDQGYDNRTTWYAYSIPVSGTGVQTFKTELYCWKEDGPSGSAIGIIAIDHVILIEKSTFTLSGYVTNNLEDSVSSATITLNNSGGETTSNDTGYYEITELSSSTYSITATSPTHEDYSGSVTVSSDTEKNITMTRLSPVLTYTDSDTTVADVFLFWKRNLVVDNVRIYKDTETRLLTTVGNGAYLSGMYSDKNLDCNKGYVYWLQPMDGSIAGPKYRIDAKTDPCIDGGSGGTVPDSTPDLTPGVTPGPTVPPEINMTQEEWLNLTLVEKQDVLANITLMAPEDGLFSPLLEFKWEDVLVWGIHLFLILCAILALDSITTQKMSEYTGLFAIIPGVVFAYLGGYLVI